MRAPLTTTGRLLLYLLTAAAFAQSADGTVITVDVNGQGDYSNLFNGIYWSDAGDTILVYPGVYAGAANHDLALPQRDLTLMSRDGPEVTILNLEGSPGIKTNQYQTTATVIDGFTFTSGEAPFSDYGVRAVGGSGCKIRNCVFDDRAKASVGGEGTKLIWNCVFTRNDPAISITDPGQVMVRNCAFTDNGTGISLGGAGSSPYEVSVVGCDFDANTRALYLTSYGPVRVDSCSFSNSTHGPYFFDYGTSVKLTTQTGADVHIGNCSFAGNHSTRNAGVISVAAIKGSTVINDCAFTHNTADGVGGAIYNEGYYFPREGSVLVDDCVFADNSAGGTGGAICNGGRHLTVSGCTFTGNSGEAGGAVYTTEQHSAGETSISDCVFVDNEAEEGGAIAVTLQTAIVSGCEFSGNVADMGGAIFVGEALTEMTDCLFAENRAHIWGGAACFIDVQQLPGFKIYSSTFDSNRAHRGAAVMMDHCRGLTSGCTLFGNRAEDASIVATRASRADIERCIVSFAGEGPPVAVELQSATHSTNCTSFGNAGGDSLSGYMMYEYDCLYEDPRFCNIASGDYSLCANSPCLPDNNSWTVAIGAHGQGCSTCSSPVEVTSWGAIKALYR